MPDRNNERQTWESYFGRRPQPSALQLFKRLLALERKHTERILASLLVAVRSEIASAERRTATKLTEIDASINLIALELARRAEKSAPESADSD
jgi:hypothetical protein